MVKNGKSSNPGPDLQYIHRRIKKKFEDYQTYHFSANQNDILKTFFDLAQEFDSFQDFYRICVLVPCDCLQMQVSLYLEAESGIGLQLVCNSSDGVRYDSAPAPSYVRTSQEPYDHEGSYLVPISRKQFHQADAPAMKKAARILGMLEVSAGRELSGEERFFFIKYANRIAYNLHNRKLMQQNIRHLEFINTLVMDIEHNVIIPNMYFKHLFNRLKASIGGLEELVLDEEGASEPYRGRLATVYQGLRENHRQLLDHHSTTSLFLESLFRKDHFTEGHLVLKPRSCMVEQEIIRPQLENYLNRFSLYGIEVRYPDDMEDELPLSVDIGLLAQVYANLFSNAVKYTESVKTAAGFARKAMAYGRKLEKDYFGPGKDGMKFNVFSTGPQLSATEQERVFDDGFRGSNSGRSSGTGHGLSFVRHVIEIHGGRVGYESVEEGNNFYFVLPLAGEYKGMKDVSP
ncbi:MAG: HAMP domain-containing histidine kinase [Proteobacteria bacterium]|nr:HAMP domain-containing histidine kinase [Pseudomonadota bacterium]MBU1737381.1 HAMP domain-containing histidine kinase [Pseudomonadota bacterium]